MSREPDPAVLYPDVAAHGSLDEIGKAATFDLLTGRFEVPDNNPADVIASEWQWMLKDAEHADWPQYQALIESAHAEPKLRRLYPYTGHWALGFAERHDSPYSTPSFVSIDSPRGAGDYAIREWRNGPVLHHVTTAAEAIAIAVDRIPADLLRTASENPAQEP
ncbi:DUF6193 family natural product biosynthesis protein [Streptomyces venezuelae]|uniref:DUF6193 family natural product biosynthesis protein n=1 Tax=Streptomyces venezuelae TaxID=54571 RepID=UPI003320A7D1